MKNCVLEARTSKIKAPQARVMIAQHGAQRSAGCAGPYPSSPPGTTRFSRTHFNRAEEPLFTSRAGFNRRHVFALDSLLQRIFRRPRARLRADGGGATIEFAVSILTVTLLVFAIFEFSMLLYTYNVMSDAAREGLRYAIVHGSDSTLCSGPGCSDSSGTNVTATVRSYAKTSFHNINGITITPSWPDGSSAPGSRVTVLISYQYMPYVKVPGMVSPTMRLVSEGRIVF